MDTEITTSEAAKLISCTESFVRRLLRDEKIKGRRIGRDWLVSRGSALAYRDSDRRVGRPAKDDSAATP